MNVFIAILASGVAFAFLAYGSARVRSMLKLTPLFLRATLVFRSAAFVTLLLSIYFCVFVEGWATGLVLWFGTATVSSATIISLIAIKDSSNEKKLQKARAENRLKKL